MYNTVSDIKAMNKALGQTWFGASEMRFFNTIIEANGQVFGGRYFITSDRMERTDPKRYTIRRANDNGSITTVGDLSQYATLSEARDVARGL